MRAPITPEDVRGLFYYDAVQGGLYWRAQQRGPAKAGDRAGTLNKGYRRVCVRRASTGEHRMVWAWHHGMWPAGDIDHINHDKADNRIENLRDVTRAVNNQNRVSANRRSTVGLLGVVRTHPEGRGPTASIKVGEKRIHLGTFDTAEAAHAAYVTAKRRLHVGNTL